MNLPSQNQEVLTAAGCTNQLQSMPSGYRPWEDTTLSPEQRFEAYKVHVSQEVEGMLAAAQKLGSIEFQDFERSEATQNLLAHAEELTTMTLEEYSARLVSPNEIRGTLGKAFLGAEEWKSAFGVDVGAAPLIPASVTKELLESSCPFFPDRKIKDTHLLVLMPQTVNGKPFSGLQLDELCSDPNLTGYHLIEDNGRTYTDWKQTSWASKSLNSSAWVLLLKVDPSDGRLRNKGLRQQLKVLESDYPDYRQAQALERMTAALLYEVTHQERIPFWSGRCEEPSFSGDGRVLVTCTGGQGLNVLLYDRGTPASYLGLAVRRKL